MAKAPVFKIGDDEYPIPTKFRLGDPVLIEELTGLDMVTFGELVDGQQQTGNAKVLLGLVGVAVWQAHPDWPRSKVAAFANNIDFEAFAAEVPEIDPPELPAQTPETPSADSSNESTTIPELSADGVPV